MNKIYLDIDNNKELILNKYNNIISFDEYILEYKSNIQILTGIIVLIDDKILLVKPKKFKETDDKWSIPKGKLDNNLSKKENAIKELKEETGIEINKEDLKNAEKIKIYYKKSNNIKELISYIIELNKNEIVINKRIINKDEIYKVKLFTFDEAFDKLEVGQIPLLRMIKNKYKQNV